MSNPASFKSVKHNEWMYAGYPKLDDDRRHVLTWGQTGSDPSNDPTMQWEIKEYGDYVGIRSIKHNEWMYAGYPKFSDDRRHALTWGQTGSDPSNDPTMRWIMHRDEVLVAIEFGEANIKAIRPKASNESVLKNDGDAELTAKFTYTESMKTTNTVSWETNVGVTVGAGVKATTGILPGGEVSASIELSVNVTSKDEWAVEKASGVTIEASATVKAGKRVKLTANLYEVDCDIPFVAKFKSGKTAKGTWSGMLQSRAEYGTENLN